MADLPDYYTQAAIAEAEAAKFKGGLDANKSATPVSRDTYLATDTLKLYICVVDGTWTGFDASILVQGILTLYANLVAGGYRLTGLGAPIAQDDALRYGRAEIRNAEIAAAAAIVYSKLNLALGIVHGDVATANKDGTTATPSLRTLGTGAQQAAAGDHTHTLAEDIVGDALTALVTDTSQAGYKEVVTVPFGEDVDIATKTQTYAALSMAVAVGHCHWWAGDADVFKLRLYMDGTEVAESAYAAANETAAWQLVATRALSGSAICKIAVHSYHVSINKAGALETIEDGGPCPAGIGIGSVTI